MYDPFPPHAYVPPIKNKKHIIDMAERLYFNALVNSQQIDPDAAMDLAINFFNRIDERLDKLGGNENV